MTRDEFIGIVARLKLYGTEIPDGECDPDDAVDAMNQLIELARDLHTARATGEE